MINEFLQSSLIFDNSNTLIMSLITSGFVVVSTKTKNFYNGWNEIRMDEIRFHLLTITIRKNHDKMQWVFQKNEFRGTKIYT